MGQIYFIINQDKKDRCLLEKKWGSVCRQEWRVDVTKQQLLQIAKKLLNVEQ